MEKEKGEFYCDLENYHCVNDIIYINDGGRDVNYMQAKIVGISYDKKIYLVQKVNKPSIFYTYKAPMRFFSDSKPLDKELISQFKIGDKVVAHTDKKIKGVIVALPHIYHSYSLIVEVKQRFFFFKQKTKIYKKVNVSLVQNIEEREK